MPAIHLSKRQYNSSADGRRLTPTAVGFLVPLMMAFVCAPFIYVVFMRRRRQGRPPDYVLNLRTPAQRKAEARAKLATVTEVSSVASGGDGSSVKEKGCSAETTSILERECAICLSTLYAPSPPEPARTTGAPLSSEPPPIAGLSGAEEREEMLKLNVCGHEYHMECLLSWFLVRKYSCPICRAVYYSTRKVGQPSAEGEESRQEQNEGNESASGDNTGHVNENAHGNPAIDTNASTNDNTSSSNVNAANAIPQRTA